MSRTSRFLLSVLLCCLPPAPARGQDADEKSPAPIKIGVIYGFSGPAALWADYGRKGLELALEEINSSGGVNGRKIELLFEDSKSQGAGAVAGFTKLAKVDGVQAVIGDVWAYLVNPLIPLAGKFHIPLVSPTVMEESVDGSSPWLFLLGHRVQGLKNATRLFFDLNPEIRTLGILCWDDPWGQAYLKLWLEIVKEKNIELIYQSCQRDFTYDYAAEVARLAARKTDAVIFAHMEQTLRRLDERRFRPKLLTTSNIVEVAVRHLAPIELLEGVYYPDWPPEAGFKAAFERKFGVPPLIEAHNHYEALRALAKAFAAKPSDPRAALAQLHYRGVTGEIDFRRSSAGNWSEGRLMQFKNGAGLAVEPPAQGGK